MHTAKSIYGNIAESMSGFLKKLHDSINSPDNIKKLRTFQLKELCEMTGKSRTSLLRLQSEGLITPLRDNSGGPGYNRYTLADINKVREKFDSYPSRDSETDKAFTLLIQNFKGGVSKSTTALNLGMSYALKGYRVLLVDNDPQASLTTMLCGSPPDLFCSIEDTIAPFVNGEKETLDYAVRRSHVDRLDFIPACSQLTMLDITSGLTVAEIQEEGGPNSVRDYYNSLKIGLETISNNYDIIILDSPPTLGFISTMALLSANGHVVPCPAMSLDFASTSEYFSMAQEVLRVFKPEHQVHFVKFLVTKYSRSAAQNELLDVMRLLFGDEYLIHSVFHQRADVQNLATEFKSVPEAPATKKYQGLKDNVEDIAYDIEKLIWQFWPSKNGQTPKQ